MKTIFTYALPVIISLFISSFGNAQSSKSCGSCHKPVSVNSEVGDYCPHCHVRWGYENTSTNYVDSYDKNYNYVDLMGYLGVNLWRREICLFVDGVNISLTLTVTQRWQRGYTC